MCRVRSNQKFEISLSTRPLPGIGSGSTTSKADSRSVVTISMRRVIDGVDVAHLALVDALEAAQLRCGKRWLAGMRLVL